MGGGEGERAGAQDAGNRTRRMVMVATDGLTEWAKALSESAIYHRTYDRLSDRLVVGGM